MSWRCMKTSQSKYFSLSHMKKYGRYGYVTRVGLEDAEVRFMQSETF